MAESTWKHIKIETKEHVEMGQMCEELKKRMDEADSDVAYQGYRRAWAILTTYHEKATREIHAVERAEARKESREKRAARTQKGSSKAS